ncbi:shikimate dehydrogenase [Streptomyces kunmingensis]|uniref:Shikimate dehydrogenase n=1 Tax=Streptomyces kunmingensis TaxID=68225 RepID=A0ABU6CEN5_9ACTN|nr:shikimate dehydrogenase [Streptomyces kunmingensis]MEB3963161.1 shikimate dehydrogenase [Streptomyces kunmingensis]
MTQNSYLLALVGTGIEQSLSPELHEREARRHGLRCLYRLQDLNPPPDEAGDRLGEHIGHARLVGFSGLNITHPYKQLVIPHLDQLSPAATRVGAVNTVVFTRDAGAVGHNTDIAGFAAAFTRNMPDARTESVVQLGAGGAGAAVGNALLDLGVRHLVITDPNRDRAHTLAKALNEQAGAERARACTAAEADEQLSHADGLVNASPVGTEHHLQLPVPARSLHPGLWVADVNYHPLWTPLLHTAHALGCTVLHGGGMLVHQAADAFRLFTGRDPSTSHMLADFAEITADVQAHT